MITPSYIYSAKILSTENETVTAEVDLGLGIKVVKVLKINDIVISSRPEAKEKASTYVFGAICGKDVVLKIVQGLNAEIYFVSYGEQFNLSDRLISLRLAQPLVS